MAISFGAQAQTYTPEIWEYSNTPCTGVYCPGWELWDSDPTVEYLFGADSMAVSDVGYVYKLVSLPAGSQQVWRSSSSSPGWVLLSSATDYAQIVARGGTYLRHNSGEIDQWIAQVGGGGFWKQIDDGKSIDDIEAGGGANEVYELLGSGQIWRYTGSAWQEIDNNSLSISIAAGNNEVYQMHQDGSIWRYTGTPCANGACHGWVRLDDNALSGEIVADSDNNLYQLHFGDGSIWKYTGTPCNGNACHGWQKLDDNPATDQIVAAGGSLYQWHVTSGQIWQYTGTPCNGNVCTGWRMLDDNPATGFIVAGGSHLFQVHTFFGAD